MITTGTDIFGSVSYLCYYLGTQAFVDIDKLLG